MRKETDFLVLDGMMVAIGTSLLAAITPLFAMVRDENKKTAGSGANTPEAREKAEEEVPRL
jgi:hypothetical protein